MKARRLVFSVMAFAVFLLVAPSLFVSAARDHKQQGTVDEEGVPIWSDDRPSDEPLRGSDVVRRDQEELDSLVAREDFIKSWILVLDGERQAAGGCGFTLEFSENADTATSKVFFATAYDRATCATEWIVGIPAHPVLPPEPDLVVSYDGETDREGDQKVGFMNPEAVEQLGDDAFYYPLPQIRYTVVAEWMDPPHKIVNRVNSAVKAKVDKQDDKQSNQHCKNQRAGLWTSFPIVSHWHDRSTGSWGRADCNKSNYATKAITSARFYNEDFKVCDDLDDPAWVYYDSVYARASSSTSKGSFAYGMTASWQEGCGEILGWAGFRTYKDEYNPVQPV